MKIGKYRHQLAVCQMLFVLSRLQHSPDGRFACLSLKDCVVLFVSLFSFSRWQQ